MFKQTKATKTTVETFDVENSEANTSLSTLICKRIEHEKELKARNNFMPTKAIPDLRHHLADLRKELEAKKNAIANIKETTNIKNNQFERVKTESVGPDHHLNILQLSQEGLKDYISSLKKLKVALKDVKKKESADKTYQDNFEKRHKKLVEDLDSNGLTLNDKLTDLLTESDSNENKVAKSLNKINAKVDQREDIKLSCKEVDKMVTQRSESSSIDLHKLLQILGKLMKQKSDLKAAVNDTESDSIEYNAILREMQGHDSNSQILKHKSKIIEKKHRMVDYLTKRHMYAKKGHEKAVEALKRTSNLPLQDFRISNGRREFDADIDDLQSELVKCKNLEKYLIEEIRKHYGSLEIARNSRENENIREDILEQIKELIERRNANFLKLGSMIGDLVALGHQEFEKTREVKVLEGQLILDGYEHLERQRIELLKYLKELEARLNDLRGKPRYRDLTDILYQLGQKERLIIMLVNQLRNLDDKILYVKTNAYHSPCKRFGCKYHSKSPAKVQSTRHKSHEKSHGHGHSHSKYAGCSYHQNLYGSNYHSRQQTITHSLSQSYNAQSLGAMIQSTKYKEFVPSDEELKNLIPENMLFKIRRLDSKSFEINRSKFTFLRDSDGNTYAQDGIAPMALYEFLEKFKSSKNAMYFSPVKTTTIRHVYHSYV